MLFTHLFVPLTMSKVLPLGNEKKSELSFCISLVYSYLCRRFMNNRTRRLSAWLLLSVFLPMLLLSSLHVHESVPVSSGCSECVNHIPHQGHLSIDTIHANDCVLCQFATLPFLMASIVVVAAITWGHKTAIVKPSARLQYAVGRHHSPRAPPVFI